LVLTVDPQHGRNRMMALFPSYALPLDLMGDGTRAACRILMAIAASQDTVLFVDEIESHQHPLAMERLALALCRLSTRQSVQLVVTTHSADCVDRMMSAAEKSGVPSSVVHLANADGIVKSTAITGSEYLEMRRDGLDVRYFDLYA
jgi:AAA15 family ATPase/GTPase